MLNLAAIRREVTIGLLPGTLEGAGQPRAVLTNVVFIDWLTALQVDLANVLPKKAPRRTGARLDRLNTTLARIGVNEE